MNLYVGNLNYGVTDEDLNELFSQYGEITSAKIIMDKFSGKSKGFGFVEFASNDDANKAVEELNGTDFRERKLVVNEARPRR
ncbi:MAG: RNA-binding protein [Melioribacteraceae bacterium]|nr:RNA-binding protein [Melioribacteraceae bacterium]MCF8411906.1 RNA-binding protein [Melioribacteraceae bacterium]